MRCLECGAEMYSSYVCYECGTDNVDDYDYGNYDVGEESCS